MMTLRRSGVRFTSLALNPVGLGKGGDPRSNSGRSRLPIETENLPLRLENGPTHCLVSLI